MRLFFIGDIVGKPGRKICTQALRGLRQEQAIDLIVANGENAAGGSGLTPPIYHELLSAGIDGITLGDHVYKRSEVIPILQSEQRIVRPANYPPEAPGAEVMVLTVGNEVRVAVFLLLGRVFMPPVDCPFHAADRVLAALPADIRVIVLDFHAEATSDKQVMAPASRRPRHGRVGHAHPRAHRRRASPARRHGLSVRRGHDRSAREHPGPADRSRDGDDVDPPADLF